MCDSIKQSFEFMQKNKLAKLFLFNQYLSIGLIFISALVFRIILVNKYHVSRISNDEITYLTLAANIAERHSYTSSPPPQDEPSFFREPGYPLFLASIASLYKMAGNDIIFPHSSLYGENTIPEQLRSMILFLKSGQAVLGALNVIIFYFILTLFFRKKYCLIIALIYAFYFPDAILCSFLLRENLQTTLIMFFSYFTARYLTKQSLKDIAFSGIFVGLSIMTFQAMAILGPALAAAAGIAKRKMNEALLHIIIAGFCAIVVVTPWTLRAYRRYSSWSVIPTFGVSLTHDWRRHAGMLRVIHRKGIISDETFIQMESQLYHGDQFVKTIDGTHKREAEKLRELVPDYSWKDKFFSISSLKTRVKRMCFALVNMQWISQKFSNPVASKVGYIDYLLLSVMSLLTVIGLLCWFPKLWKSSIALAVMFLFSNMLMSASRRIAPVGYFLYLYMLLGLITVAFYAYRRKRSLKELYDRLLIPHHDRGVLTQTAPDSQR